MKSLTRDQSNRINVMTISDKQKKLVRKIVRFVNNKNQYFKDNHDNPNTQYDVNLCSQSLSIVRKDRPGDISIDVYFYSDSKSPSLEISLSSKPDGANTWFIKHELFDLIYGE